MPERVTGEDLSRQNLYFSCLREREEISPAGPKKTLSVAQLSLALSLLILNHNRDLTVVKKHSLTRSDPL